MMLLHAVNAIAWMANAVVWAFWAQVPLMAVASLAAAGLSVLLARNES